VTVPPYYIVTAANMSAPDPWASITQSIYGSTNPDVVNGLKTYSGTPTLTAGLHLPAPTTLAYNVTTVTGTQTDVTDPLGFKTSYFTNLQGQLTRVASPGVNGSSTVNGTRLDTFYTYDAAGNVTRITDARGNITTMEYDARGNLTLTRDSEGNTVTRTYSDTNATNPNQLLTETLYRIPDPDGSGSQLPGTPLTTRYVYDGENHLRFVISAEGRVTEHRYDVPGNRTTSIAYAGKLYNLSGLGTADPLSETQLQNWVNDPTLDKTKSERTDYEYDVRGNVKTATNYTQTDVAGAGVISSASITRFFYDQRGKLLQSIDARGSANVPNPASPNLPYATTYTYDSLGRVLSTIEWVETGVLRSVVTTYGDANDININQRTTVTVLDNGLSTTRLYDRRGLLLNVSQTNTGQALGTSTYQYDADGLLRITTDPTGVRTFYLYDEAGRKIATIDGAGALTEMVYDQAGNVIREIG